jgi:hypothetical protein
MGISTKGNANTRPGTKKGAAPSATSKTFGSKTQYAEASKTHIAIKGKK